jgi:hypothetical protein
VNGNRPRVDVQICPLMRAEMRQAQPGNMHGRTPKGSAAPVLSRTPRTVTRASA